jgi:hypothetical protein
VLGDVVKANDQWKTQDPRSEIRNPKSEIRNPKWDL